MQRGTLRARWVTCDEGFGNDPAFLARLDARDLWSLAEVPCATQVWPLADPATGQERPRPTSWVPPQTASRKGPVPRRTRVHPQSPAKMRVDASAAQLPAAAWQRYRILAGSKGPLVADFAAVRAVAVRDRLPAEEVWVVLRRKVEGPPEVTDLTYSLSNVPADVPLETLVWVSGLRWPIESCVAACKGERGRDHYEGRFWPGWHHHMTLVFLAHHVLVRLQARLDQREGGVRTVRSTPRSAAPNDDPAGASLSPADPGSGGAAPTRAGVAPERGRGAPPAAGAPPPAALRPPGGGRAAARSAPAQARGRLVASQAPATAP